jgi:hypothetical protein
MARRGRRASGPARAAPITHGMDIAGVFALRLQANALDSVRATLAGAQAQPATPAAQADAILQLSSAASALLTGDPTA